MSTKVARLIPLTIPDIVNVPVPEALVTTKEAVSPFSVRVKLPFGLMLNGVPAVKTLRYYLPDHGECRRIPISFLLFPLADHG
jgi:hypothetical protein